MQRSGFFGNRHIREMKMINVLLVTGNKSLSSLTMRKLQDEPDYTVVHASTLPAARELIGKPGSDYFIGLIDLAIENGSGEEIVDLAIENGIPPVVFTRDYDVNIRERIWAKKVVDFVAIEGTQNIDYIVSLIMQLDRNRSYKVLVADDSPEARKKLVDLLKVHQYDVFEAVDGDQAVRIMLEQPEVKLVIADYDMPDMDGFELTTIIRERYDREHLAIIGIAARDDKEIATRFIKNGANDYIDQPFSTEEFYCRVTHNVEMIEYVEEIEALSNRDFLTGLYNRRYFFQSAGLLFENAKRQNMSIRIAMLDIDHFKKVNDTWGHDGGDMVLKKMASILMKRFRASDVVARFGGEEFCVLMTNIDEEQAFKSFEGLRKEIETTPFDVGERTIPIAISIGLCTPLLESLDDMITKADEMLYQAKEGGRNRIVVA